MSLKASASTGGGVPREVLDAGNYPARVAQIIDLGLQKQRPYEGKEKAPVNEIMVTYELVTEFLQDEDGNDDTTKPRWISERFPLYSLGSDRAKSTTRYLAIDPNKDCAGDWSLMVGKPCLVAVVNNVSKSNGKTYNNVGGISLPIKGMVVPELVNESKVFSLDEPDMEVFTALPEWIQSIITENLEFNGSAFEGILTGKGKKAPKEEKVSADDAEARADGEQDVPY
jgi:hypothetical protein